MHKQRSMWRIALRVITVMSTCVPALVVLVPLTPAEAVTNPVAVTMSASSSPVASNSSLTYTIVATDTEPQQANVRLTDQLTGLTNVVLASSRGYCSLSNSLVTCDAGTMPGQGSTWTVTITGLVTAGNGTYLNNTATVTGDWSPQNTSQTFSVPATTSVLVSNGPLGGLPDLSASIIAPGTANAGSSQTYQVVVNNSGGSNATDIQTNITLPPGFSLQTPTSVNGTSLFQCTTSLPSIVCKYGAVNAGANATITIGLVVSSTTPPANGLQWTTTAAVDPENAIPESNELNNTAQQTLLAPGPAAAPGLANFTKTAVSPIDNLAPTMPAGSQVRPGDVLTYTVKATNTSTKDTLTRVQVTDGTQGLDQASVSVKSSDSKFICANSNSQVKCAASNNNYTLGANGGFVTVTITGRVVQPPSSIITNTATLQGLQNKITITRTASVTTIVRPAVDLTVTNYDTCVVPAGNPHPAYWRALLPDNSPGGCNPSGTYRARNQFDYLVTVGNSGINDAAGVAIRIPLPNDVIYEGYDNLGTANFSCPAGSAPVPPSPNFVLVCTGGTVPGQATSGFYPGDSRQLRIHLTAPNSTGAITAVTTVDPYNAIAESDETNNTFTTTTPIATGVDLSVEQSSLCPRDTRQPSPNMCNPVAPSGTLMYHILVTNVGTQDASGIKVTDTLPAGARFRSAKEVPPFFPSIGTPYTPTHNVTCSSDGASLVTCTGGRLAGIYAAYGGPLLPPAAGTPDSFMIEVKAFAPAPFGPNTSPNATGSPILNQVQVDPDNTIPEFIETNAPNTDNINLLETNVGIPPLGDWGTYNELTVKNDQTNPASGPVAPNGTLDYTLTVSNWGSDPVSNITVTDNVPDGARLRNVTADGLSGGSGGFGCAFANGVVTCTNGALAASSDVGPPNDARTHIYIHLFAPPTVKGSTTQYTNHAVVDPANVVPEADETNNVSDASLTVELPTPSGPFDPTHNSGGISGGGQNTFNDLTVLDQQVSPVDGTGPCEDTVAPQLNCAPVAPNGTLKYDLTVANRGSDPVSNVTVADYIPQGSRFRNVTADALNGGNGGFVCSFNAGVVTCTNGSLQGGNGYTKIHILLYAPDAVNFDGLSNFTNIYTNHAVVDPNNNIAEGDETNNTSDVQLLVQNAPNTTPNNFNAYNELQISTPQEFPTSNGAVAPSGTLVYDVTVSNQGSDPATNVTFKDYLPTGTTYRLARQATASAGSGGFVCSHNGGVVTCNNGTLAAGGQVMVKVTLFAPAQPSDPGSLPTTTSQQITNQVVVDPDNTIPEGNETNNTATQDTTVSQTGAGAYWDATVVDQGSDTTGTPDDQVQWTFAVSNLGTDDLFNATFRAILPPGTTFVAAGEALGDPDRFTCTQNSGVVTCTGGTLRGMLNGGTPRLIHVVVKAPHQNVGMIMQAQVDPDNVVPESNESNNAIRLNTIVSSVINLSIELDKTGITQSQYGTITGRIKNNIAGGSGEDAHNVLSVWNLPVGVTVEDVQAGATTPSGTSCSTATDDTVNQVTCVTDTLAAGATLEFNFYVYQNNDQTDNDNAVVNGNHATVESDDGNDTDSTVQSQVTQ